MRTKLLWVLVPAPNIARAVAFVAPVSSREGVYLWVVRPSVPRSFQHLEREEDDSSPIPQWACEDRDRGTERQRRVFVCRR